MKKHTIAGTVLLFFILFSYSFCGRGHHSPENSAKTNYSLHKTDTLIIECDSSIGHNYYIALISFAETDSLSPEGNNTILQFLQETDNNQFKVIFEDGIYSQTRTVEFTDYNNDGITDILVQHTSSARSNWAYNLFLVSPNRTRLTKIRHFEEIPNPTYNTEYDIITNYVLSGVNYTRFYKLQGDSVFDYNITIEDVRSEDKPDDTSIYDSLFIKAILKIKGENKKAPQPK